MSKTAYICSRYRADTQEQFDEQMRYTKTFAHEAVMAGDDVIVPHMYYPQFLDDNNKTERKLGMESAIRLLHKCDIVLVYIGLGVSEGMEAEIEEAKKQNKKMCYFGDINDVRPILETLDIDQGVDYD